MEDSGRVREGRFARLRAAGGAIVGQRRRLATVAAAALAVGVGYHIVFGHNGLTMYEQKRHDERQLQLQLQMLADENDALKGHVERLANDPGAIEHEAREELHYTRPGEVIVKLPSEQAAEHAEPGR